MNFEQCYPNWRHSSAHLVPAKREKHSCFLGLQKSPYRCKCETCSEDDWYFSKHMITIFTSYKILHSCWVAELPIKISLNIFWNKKLEKFLKKIFNFEEGLFLIMRWSYKIVSHFNWLGNKKYSQTAPTLKKVRFEKKWENLLLKMRMESCNML